MVDLQTILGGPEIERLGWLLFHFVWQGLALAALLAMALVALRRASANARYVVSCVTLVVMALCPLATWPLLSSAPPVQQPTIVVNAIQSIPSQPAPAAASGQSHQSAPEVKSTAQVTARKDQAPCPGCGPIVPPPFDSTSATANAKPALRLEEDIAKSSAEMLAGNQLSLTQWRAAVKHWLPWCVMLWLAGVAALSLRLLVGCRYVRILGRSANVSAGAEQQAVLTRLIDQLSVTRPVRLVQSALVEVPTVIGWLRPIILLPVSALAGMSPAEFESLLAHELAHIRRHDYLVNLLQSIIEIVLFYHPAVWWVSSKIREERENCCDDWAVRVCGDRISYARALAQLEEHRSSMASLAMAAGGGRLLPRIRRILGAPDVSRARSSYWLAGAAVLLVMATTTLAIGFSVAIADQPGWIPGFEHDGDKPNLPAPAASTVKLESIPNRATVLTEKKFQLARLKYLGRDPEEYKQHTSETGEARAAGLKFLEEFNRTQTQQPGFLTEPELTALGKKTLATGCKDPLVVMRYGMILSNQHESAEAKRLLKQAQADLATGPYSPRQAALAHLWDQQFAARLEEHPPHEQVQKAMDAMLAWLASEPDQRGQRRFMYAYLRDMSDALDPADAETLVGAAAKLPKLDPWLKEMVAGVHDRRAAWEARGGGWASEITPEGGKVMRERLALSSQHLHQAWKIDSTLPETATEMINTAKAGGDQEHPRIWFDRAVKNQFDDMKAYYNLRDALRSRWHGSTDSLLDFGLQCADTRRYDTDVPLFLISCIAQIEQDEGFAVWQRDGVWRKVREVYTETAKRRKGRERDKLLSLHAAAAVRAGQFADARAILERLKDNVDPDGFGARELDPVQSQSLVFAATGSVGPQVQKLLPELARVSSLDAAAQKRLRDELGEIRRRNKDPRADGYLAFWQLALQRQEVFDRGDWVELKFTDQLAGWKISGGGEWKVLDENSVLLTDDQPGLDPPSSRLEPSAAFSGPMEIEVTLEHVGSDTFCLSGGVAVGNVRNSPVGRYIYLNPEAEEASIQFYNRAKQPKRIALPSKTFLKIKAWPNFMEVNFGDETIWQYPDAIFDPAGGLALATPQHQHGRGSLKFSNFRVRKLDYGPPGKGEESRKTLDYYADVLKREPNNITARYFRYYAFYDQRKLAEALEEVTQALKISPNSCTLHINRGDVLKNHHRQVNPAIVEYDEAARLNPQSAPAQRARGNMMLVKKQLPQAMEAFAAAARIDPEDLEAHQALAWFLATTVNDKIRNGPQAVKHAQRAVDLTRQKSSDAISQLAIAQAECGKFDEALKTMDRAMNVATPKEKEDLKKYVDSFKENKPIRDARFGK